MCLNDSPTPEEIRVEPQRDEMSGIASAIQYTLPVYRETEGCNYIEFYAFDPNKGRLRRKRIKTNRIKGIVKRRQYVRDLIKRITDQLSRDGIHGLPRTPPSCMSSRRLSTGLRRTSARCSRAVTTAKRPMSGNNHK